MLEQESPSQDAPSLAELIDRAYTAAGAARSKALEEVEAAQAAIRAELNNGKVHRLPTMNQRLERRAIDLWVYIRGAQEVLGSAQISVKYDVDGLPLTPTPPA